MKIKSSFKFSKTIKILFFISIFIVLLIKIYNGILQNEQAFLEDLPLTNSLPIDVNNLIKKEYRDKFKVKKVYNSKVRNPISVTIFDEKYSVLIYKLTSDKYSNLNDIIEFEEKNIDRSVGYTYSIIENNSNKFEWRAGIIKPEPKIYVTYSGDSVNFILKNSNIFNFQFSSNNFSIRNDKKGPIDIYITRNNNFFLNKQNNYLNVLFKIYKHEIYLLIATSVDRSERMPPNLLYDFITKDIE